MTNCVRQKSNCDLPSPSRQDMALKTLFLFHTLRPERPDLATTVAHRLYRPKWRLPPAMFAAITALLVVIVPVCRAAQTGAHVHGVANLEVAVDGATITVALRSPLGNLSGFEHAPRNDNERRQVRAMAARLPQPDKLFAFTPAARCRPESSFLESDRLEPALLSATAPAAPGKQTQPVSPSQARSRTTHAHDHHEHNKHTADTHAELDATWQFRCTAPHALQGLDLQALFRAFPGIRQLDAVVAGPRNQSGSRLSPGMTRLKW